MTSVFGAALLVGIPVMFITGLVSYAAYNPRLGGNDTTPQKGLLGFYLFNWITNPSWIYRVSQGTHVILGLTLTPILLAKLWSVMPKLTLWPRMRTVAEVLERVSLVLLVGGALFQFATGILEVDYFYTYVWHFSFYDAHLFGAWLFIAGFVAHVALKLPKMVSSLRSRSLRTELATGLAATESEPADPDGLVASDPAAPTISRRGVIALVGGSALAVFGLTVGQTTGNRFLRRTALLAPRGRTYGAGPNDFQINTTAAEAAIQSDAVGQTWQLQLVGAHKLALSRQALLAMPLVTASLPIACVDGWSTEQRWTGVRLIELARLVGANRPASAFVQSLQSHGTFSQTTLSASQVADDQSLLALKVNGVDLSMDHGFPARVIIPAGPGVHNTKWVQRITFGREG